VHVCRATIQACKKKYFIIPERIPDFREKKILKNGTVFRAKVELFLVLPKFYWNNIFQKQRAQQTFW
jgi:hypothetical protein